MSDKHGVCQDSYCYPGATVFRNKPGIRDDSTLNDAEQHFSALSAATSEFSLPPYSLASLQKIHRNLFSDLYDWAGELRTVGIPKQDTRLKTVPHPKFRRLYIRLFSVELKSKTRKKNLITI